MRSVLAESRQKLVFFSLNNRFFTIPCESRHYQREQCSIYVHIPCILEPMILERSKNNVKKVLKKKRKVKKSIEDVKEWNNIRKIRKTLENDRKRLLNLFLSVFTCLSDCYPKYNLRASNYSDFKNKIINAHDAIEFYYNAPGQRYTK